MKLSKKDKVDIITWLIEIAKEWRGSLVGNPDPRSLADYDFTLNLAKKMRKKMKGRI